MPKLTVERFEIVRDRDNGDVCIFFMGRIGVAEGASLALDGVDATVRGNGGADIEFPGLHSSHLEWLATAPSIYVNRTFQGGDEMRQVRLERA